MGKWKTIDPGMWKPENKGDSVEGILVNKEPADKSKDLSAKYHIENKDGMYLVWGSAIIDDRMQYVKVGSEIRITFEGRGANSKGQKLNLFKVEVAEGEGEESNKEPPQEQSASSDAVPVEKIEDAPS